jgi:hypothetical protein
LINNKYFPLLMFGDRIQWPLTGAPVEFVKEAHANGCRVIPYVCFSELSDLSRSKDRGHYNALFDIKNHGHDWGCVNPKGDLVVSPWGIKTKQPYLYSMCFNATGYHEKVLAVVKTLMDSGIDGLFIDNVGAWAAGECSGAKMRFHKHSNPVASQPEMYLSLLEKVYKLVKSYGEDKIVIHNGHISWKTCDGEMVEDFLQLYGSDDFWPPSKQYLLEHVESWEEAQKAGKAVLVLSYVMASKNENIKKTPIIIHTLPPNWQVRYGQIGSIRNSTRKATDLKSYTPYV